MSCWRLLEVLREDNRAITRAASAASKTADYLLALRTLLAEIPAASAINEQEVVGCTFADA